MKKKTLHLILTIFLLPVFFTMVLMFTGCSLDEQLWDAREETEAKVSEQEVKEEQKEQIRAWEENEGSIREDESIAVEEESSFPSGTFTYTGDMSGAPIIMIVNFETKEVTGSIACPIEGFPDYSIDDGKIDLDSLGISAKSIWIREMHNDEVVQTVEMTITGAISSDVSKIDGEIVNDLGESGLFTVYR